MRNITQNRTSDAATEPATLAEAKTHLRVTSADDDTYITSLIVAARKWAEELTWRSFITQTWEAGFSSWPVDRIFELPRPNLIAITSVVYRDTADSEQTVTVTDYVSQLTNPAVVKMISTHARPSLSIDREAPITITYASGYGAASAVPLPIKQAILLLVGHLYEIRQPVTEKPMSKVPFSVETLLNIYRFRRL